METDFLRPFINRIDLENREVYGAQLYHDGRIVQEWHRRSDYSPECIYSGTKTFVGAAIGIAREEGLLDIHKPWLEYLPEYEKFAAEGTERQTILNLLQMQGGKDEIPIDCRLDYPDDMLELWAGMPLTSEPGTKWEYINLCSYTLGRVIEKVSGQSLRDYLLPRLFNPMGIQYPHWFADRFGHFYGLGWMYLHISEYAKIGRLLLDDGRYEGRQLLSPDYARAMHTDIVTTDLDPAAHPRKRLGYGYQVWMRGDGSYSATGLYGQICLVDPKRNAVFTMQGHEEDPWRTGSLYDIIFEEVLDRL